MNVKLYPAISRPPAAPPPPRFVPHYFYMPLKMVKRRKWWQKLNSSVVDAAASDDFVLFIMSEVVGGMLCWAVFIMCVCVCCVPCVACHPHYNRSVQVRSGLWKLTKCRKSFVDVMLLPLFVALPNPWRIVSPGNAHTFAYPHHPLKHTHIRTARIRKPIPSILWQYHNQAKGAIKWEE